MTAVLESRVAADANRSARTARIMCVSLAPSGTNCASAALRAASIARCEGSFERGIGKSRYDASLVTSGTPCYYRRERHTSEETAAPPPEIGDDLRELREPLVLAARE